MQGLRRGAETKAGRLLCLLFLWDHSLAANSGRGKLLRMTIYMQAISDIVNRWSRRVPTWVIYLLGLVPFIALVVQLFAGALGVDPVKALEHRLGELGLQFLIAGLAITPIRMHLNINWIKFRRAIGLLSFFYISAHLLVWLVLDIQLLWGQIWADILKRPYITIGMLGFLLMVI